jgi:hypothetical protein
LVDHLVESAHIHWSGAGGDGDIRDVTLGDFLFPPVQVWVT